MHGRLHVLLSVIFNMVVCGWRPFFQRRKTSWQKVRNMQDSTTTYFSDFADVSFLPKPWERFGTAALNLHEGGSVHVRRMQEF